MKSLTALTIHYFPKVTEGRELVVACIPLDEKMEHISTCSHPSW